jgi:hypothetical protein
MSNPMYFPPTPFDLDAAVTCSDLVDIAYSMYSQWVAQHKPDRDGGFGWQPPQDLGINFGTPIWGNARVLLLSDWEPFALVAHRGNQAWVIFRGTESVEDWYKDAQAHQVAYDLPNINNGGKVHKGFYRLYNSLRNGMLKQLDALPDIDTLTITGHSLGAAVAMVACPDLLHNALPGRRHATIQYNLAGPRVGDPGFADLNDSGAAPIYRVVNSCDLVPEVPPPVYKDLFQGTEVYQHIGIPVSYSAQYNSIAGNHSHHDSYNYALKHPVQPQGPGA